jgi:hypothetical protein
MGKEHGSKTLSKCKIEGLVNGALQKNDVGTEARELGEELRPSHGPEVPAREWLEVPIHRLVVISGCVLECERHLMPALQQSSQEPG